MTFTVVNQGFTAPDKPFIDNEKLETHDSRQPDSAPCLADALIVPPGSHSVCLSKTRPRFEDFNRDIGLSG